MMKRKRRFQILFSGEHHYTDEEFMDKTDIFDEIMTEIFGCDWVCRMCIDFQGYEKVEAIPIEYITNWTKRLTGYEQYQVSDIVNQLLEDWRKEDENKEKK